MQESEVETSGGKIGNDGQNETKSEVIRAGKREQSRRNGRCRVLTSAHRGGRREQPWWMSRVRKRHRCAPTDIDRDGLGTPEVAVQPFVMGGGVAAVLIS
jgi:hypothetical protein